MGEIDIKFDFTMDSKSFWDGFWDRGDGLGAGGSDPDIASATLQRYHQLLWSKELPNGDIMDLKAGNEPYYYLTWKDFRFGSDSIIVGFRYYRYKYMINQFNAKQDDYKMVWEDLIRKSYTIGGTIIFPLHPSSMNQRKGMSKIISDRWDLTLECIRLYYNGEKSPLYNTILSDKKFYDLFVDFKGYVDYFFLQDAVTSDYSKVNIWYGNADFLKDGLPKTLDDYILFLEREFDFLNKRNERIADYSRTHGL
ncbi:hypothetical protein SAMN06297422_101180 [Lachnospiraceae bacterium]|nr:hypothetical protein SAMN06297422_101180 [Lachnospiraceae bacterium]